MFLDGILAISGQSGLFKLVSSGKSNVIVESLTTGKRMPAFSTSHISTLEDVAIYTDDGEIPLKNVLITIFEKFDGKIIDKSNIKDNNFLDFFQEIVPNYDRDRVYQSHVKKIITWYNLLIETNILNKESIIESQKENNADDENVEQTAQKSDEDSN